MGAKKKKTTSILENPEKPWIPNGSITARNLRSKDLRGVIFGCTHHTIEECLSEQLFGLPASHYAYVRNIYPGMALFLFNYNDRKLHGIFEAKSSGQMRISPYSWSSDGSGPTPYPAQVRVQYRERCQPLTEEQFKPVIEKNYYLERHFWFELDHKQTTALLALFSLMPFTESSHSHLMMIKYHPAKTLRTPRGSGNDNPSRATSNSHNLANKNQSFGTESQEPSGKHHPEETQSCWGRSFASVVSNKVPHVAETKFNESEAHGRQKEHKSYSEITDPWKEGYMKCEKFPIAKSIEEDRVLETYGVGYERGKELQSSNQAEELWDIRLVSYSCGKHLHESSGLMKSETQTQTITGVCESNTFVGVGSEIHSSDTRFILSKLVQEMERLKAAHILQTQKVNFLEHELDEYKQEVKLLRKNCQILESVPCSTTEACSVKLNYQLTSGAAVDHNELVFLVGGCDGASWLSSLNLYMPSSDMMTSLKSMSMARSYAATTKLNSNLYVLGGVDNETAMCYDTVASYNPSRDRWTMCSSLKRPKGNLAATCCYGKMFAIGGGSGKDCYSEVEMFDEDLGIWIQTRSMRRKRFAPAAAEIDGIIYVVGGYDGNSYLKSAERFDHREHSWTRLESMSTPRGCHSLAVLNEKIYALGGYDGTQMVPTVEVFDPRNGKWVNGEGMNIARGYAGAAVVGQSIYIMGGMKDHGEILDTVECYKGGEGWQLTQSKAIGKRCFFSAVVL